MAASRRLEPLLLELVAQIGLRCSIKTCDEASDLPVLLRHELEGAYR